MLSLYPGMWFDYEKQWLDLILLLKIIILPLYYSTKHLEFPAKDQASIVQLILVLTSSYCYLQKIACFIQAFTWHKQNSLSRRQSGDLLSLESRGINIHLRHSVPAYLWYFPDFHPLIKDERSMCPSLNPAVLEENFLRAIVRKRNEVFFSYSDLAKIA